MDVTLRSVLDCVGKSDTEPQVVRFGSKADTGSLPPLFEVLLDASAWAELGNPETITVTVEP